MVYISLGFILIIFFSILIIFDWSSNKTGEGNMDIVLSGVNYGMTSESEKEQVNQSIERKDVFSLFLMGLIKKGDIDVVAEHLRESESIREALKNKEENLALKKLAEKERIKDNVESEESSVVEENEVVSNMDSQNEISESEEVKAEEKKKYQFVNIKNIKKPKKNDDESE